MGIDGKFDKIKIQKWVYDFYSKHKLNSNIDNSSADDILKSIDVLVDGLYEIYQDHSNSTRHANPVKYLNDFFNVK